MDFRQVFGAILVASATIGSAQASPVLKRIPEVSVQTPVPAPILDQAKRAGLGDPEIFWSETYDLVQRRRALARFVSGRADDIRHDGREKSCFQAILLPDGQAELVATMGRTIWPNLDCHGIVALGALRSPGPGIRIGILYEGASAEGNRTEPLVLVWHPNGRLEIDDLSTGRVAKAHAASIGEMRAAIASATR